MTSRQMFVHNNVTRKDCIAAKVRSNACFYVRLNATATRQYVTPNQNIKMKIMIRNKRRMDFYLKNRYFLRSRKNYVLISISESNLFSYSVNAHLLN